MTCAVLAGTVTRPAVAADPTPTDLIPTGLISIGLMPTGLMPGALTTAALTTTGVLTAAVASIRGGNGLAFSTGAGEGALFSGALAAAAPNFPSRLSAYTRVNSAPKKKICAE